MPRICEQEVQFSWELVFRQAWLRETNGREASLSWRIGWRRRAFTGPGIAAETRPWFHTSYSYSQRLPLRQPWFRIINKNKQMEIEHSTARRYSGVQEQD